MVAVVGAVGAVGAVRSGERCCWKEKRVMKPQAERVFGTKSVQGVSLVHIIRITLLIKYKFIILHCVGGSNTHIVKSNPFFEFVKLLLNIVWYYYSSCTWILLNVTRNPLNMLYLCIFVTGECWQTLELWVEYFRNTNPIELVRVFFLDTYKTVTYTH